MKRTVKIIICVVLVAAMLAGTALCCCAYPTASGSGVRGKDVLNGKNWMSGIADERYLCEINLPGTHDSATAYCRNTTENHVKLFGNDVFDSGAYAKTQSLTLPQQLNAGVRYLDLRFSPKQGELLLCHGNNEKAAPVNNVIKALTALNPLLLLLAHFDRPFLSMDIEFYAYEDEACTIPLTCERALAQVKTFLRENPSETVIITAKKENGETEAFLKLFREQVEKLKTEVNPATQEPYLYTENGRGIYSKMPALSEVRGKIVLMTPFYEDLQAGDMLDAKNKAGQTDFMGVTFNYENHWSVTAGRKMKYIESFIEDFSIEMSKDPAQHLPYANVLKTNASAALRQSPYTIAMRVNESLYARNKLVKGRYYGWIMGDFMTEETCSTIWQTNHFAIE